MSDYFEELEYEESLDEDWDDWHTEEEAKSEVLESIDPAKEELIDHIIDWHIILIQAKKIGVRIRHKTVDYEERKLYALNKQTLRKILKNIIHRVYSILFDLGITPEKKPHLFTPYCPKRYKLKPAYAKYITKRIAPYWVMGKIFPPYLSSVTLDPYDEEYLSYISNNIGNLCDIELLKLEHSIENHKLKESKIIEIIKADLVRRPHLDPQLRRETENEILRSELGQKTKKQKQRLREAYRKYDEIMSLRRKDYEKQQQQLLGDGLRRRKELEELKQGKPIKRREKLGTSAAEEICKQLSTKARMRKRKRYK